MRVEKPSNKGFHPARNGTDIRFGKSKFFKDDEHNFYICKEKLFDSKTKADDLITNLEKKMNNPNLYYVPISDYDFEKFSQFCSSHYKLRIFYPLAEEDLGLEIKQRKVSLEPFSNKEMIFLLYSLIFGLSHLQELGFVHGQLAPHWIAKTTTGYAVMENPIFSPFRIVRLRSKKDIYLSPEAFRDAKYMKVHGTGFNLVKSDVFSAGLILLEAGIMRSLRDVYGGKSNTEILRPSLERKMEIFDEKYEENVLLRSTLRKMLEFDPKLRPDFLTLRRKLPNFSDILKYFERVGDTRPTPERIPVKRSSIFNQEILQNSDAVKIAKKLRKMPVDVQNGSKIGVKLKSSMGFGPSRPVALISGTEGLVSPLVNRPSDPSNLNNQILNVRFSELRTPNRSFHPYSEYNLWRDQQCSPYDVVIKNEERKIIVKEPSYNKLMTHKLMPRKEPVKKKKKKSEKEIQLEKRHKDIIFCESSSEESSTSINHSFKNKLSTHNQAVNNFYYIQEKKMYTPEPQSLQKKRVHWEVNGGARRPRSHSPFRKNQKLRVAYFEDPRPQLLANHSTNPGLNQPRLIKSTKYLERHYVEGGRNPHKISQDYLSREQIRAILTRKIEGKGRTQFNTIYSGDEKFRNEETEEFQYCSECDIAFCEEEQNLRANQDCEKKLKIFQDPYPGYRPAPVIIQPLYSSAPYYHQFPVKKENIMPSSDLKNSKYFNPKYRQKSEQKKKLIN